MAGYIKEDNNVTAIKNPFGDETDWDLIADILDQFKKDTLYLNNHQREWTETHPDHWAVVFKEELVSISPTLEDAIQAAEDRGVPCNLAAVEHLSSRLDDRTP